MISEEEIDSIGVLNYHSYAMGVCYPQCKCSEYLVSGLLSEIGELIGKYFGFKAKVVRGDDLSKTNKRYAILDEVGDVCWFLSLYKALTGKCFLEDLVYIPHPYDISRLLYSMEKLNTMNKKIEMLDGNSNRLSELKSEEFQDLINHITMGALGIVVEMNHPRYVNDSKVPTPEEFEAYYGTIDRNDVRRLLEDVLQRNIEKLYSRKDRDLIKGDGDYR